jgi:hypothetical protein
MTTGETMSQSDSWNQPLEEQAKPSGGEEVQWVTVAETFGITQATIVAGRLRAEGIPARAWQEGAGQATGLIIGKLGTGHVMVPTEFETQALEILADVDDVDEDWDEEE